MLTRRNQLIRNFLFAALLSSSVAACSGDGDGDGPDASVASDASTALDASVCQTTTLTYENFGEQFFSDFCTTCHASDAENRRGAPSGKNWDTLANVMAEAVRIDARAGTGTTMPPASAPAIPSADDRAKLSEWIACGTM